jgi:hypothetical protein
MVQVNCSSHCCEQPKQVALGDLHAVHAPGRQPCKGKSFFAALLDQFGTLQQQQQVQY